MGFLAPIVSAVSGFLGSSFIGKALLQVGLSLVSNALLKKKQTAQVSGVDLEVRTGGFERMEVAAGYVALSGQITYPNAYGPSNKYFQQVFTLSDFYTTSLENVWIEGENVTLGAEDPEKGLVVSSGDYAGLIWVKFYDGRQTTADTGLLNNGNPAGRYDNNAVGVGVSYVVVTMEFNNEKLRQNLSFVFGIKGAPLYDPRKDPAMGGVGTHDYNDPLTWEYPENYSPSLLAYNYARGFHINGDLFCGMNLKANKLPLDKWLISINHDDQLVSAKPRYACSILLSCIEQHGDNIDAILEANAAKIAKPIGELWPIPAMAKSVVATITDEDVQKWGGVKTRKSSREKINRLTGSYLDADNVFAVTPLEPVTSQTVINIDTDAKDVSVPFNGVLNPDQGQRLLNIHFNENQFEVSMTITLGFGWIALELGDWIRYNSAKWGDRTYEIVGITVISLDDDEAPRAVMIQIQEVSADSYIDGAEVVLPARPIAPGEPAYLNELPSFSVSPVQGVGDNGQVYPALLAQWANYDDPTVAGVTIYYRLKSNPSQIFENTNTTANSLVYLREGIVSSSVYEYSHKLITDPARATVQTDWAEVVSPDTPSTDVNVTLQNANEDIIETMKSVGDDARNALSSVSSLAQTLLLSTLTQSAKADRIGSLAGQSKALINEHRNAAIAENEALVESILTLTAQIDGNTSTLETEAIARASQDEVLAKEIAALLVQLETNTQTLTAAITTESETRGTNEAATASLIQTLTASVESNSSSISSNLAAIQNESSVRATNEAAAALERTALFTATGENQAAVVNEAQARNDQYNSLASDITVVSAKTDKATASGVLEFKAEAGTGGVDTSLSMLLTATNGNDTYEMGWISEIYTDGGVTDTRMIFEASKILFTNGTANASPFLFENNALTLKDLIVDNITFKTMISANGGMTINGNSGRIEIINLA